MKKHRKSISLKKRLWVLLAVGFLIPLSVICGLVIYWSETNNKENINALIQEETDQIAHQMDELIENLNYTSHQLAEDPQLMSYIGEYLNGHVKEPRKTWLSNQIHDRTIMYEIFNPNVANSTIFSVSEWGVAIKLFDTSLVKNGPPPDELHLAGYRQYEYFGPHQTRTHISNYQVISVLRNLDIPEHDHVYLYMETGFRKLNLKDLDAINRLGGVCVVKSESGEVIYTSDPDQLPLLYNLNQLPEFRKDHISYEVMGQAGWSVETLIPSSNYNHYLMTVSIGLILVCLVAVGLVSLLVSLIWRSVYRPLKLFEENLNDIISSDLQADVRSVYIEEFDKNFEYFDSMKKRIQNLISLAQEQEKEKSKLKVKQLISKMNPHFVNNTLDTLRWYADEKGYQDVYDFLSAFNRLLVYNMEKNKVTTLQTELDAVNDYITLQKMKYDIEYMTCIRLPAPMLSTEIPRFILQPLVENAIFHGVEGRGTIRVEAGLLPNGSIYIRVINNGFPIDQEKIDRIIHATQDLSSNGIGIQYVIQMLDAQFPGQYQFHISEVDGENQVEIVIPFCKGEYYAKNTDR